MRRSFQTSAMLQRVHPTIIAYKKNGKVFIRSGAGIVADSVPEKEYQECINKAKAVVNALKLAGEVEE